MIFSKKLALLGIAASLTLGGASAFMADGIDVADIKVGVIYVGDEQEGYTLSHMNGIEGMAEALGISSDQIIQKFNIPEDESCYDAAVDLADQGCQIIFGTSFGHEDYLIQAAQEFPEVEFCHATGYQAATSAEELGLENIHNYFTSIYEARYVSGVVAGLKLAELDAAGELGDDVRDADGNVKIGYVGAYSYAEVISGYTSFFLGLRSEFPNAVMEVKYTGSWADQALEKETAEALIADGCALVAQHADTTGAAAACEAGETWHVGYNVGMLDVAPNYDLTSSTNNWAPYYTYAVESVLNGEAIDIDWCHGHAEGAVLLTELGENVAEGTAEKVEETWAAIDDGSLKVFDTSTWTVDGETITSTADLDGFYGAEYIVDGRFAESETASAPAFTFIIDGVTELNQEY